MTASVPNVSHDQLRELVVAAHVWARFQAPLIGATVEVRGPHDGAFDAY
jgi:hypothetical protein